MPEHSSLLMFFDILTDYLCYKEELKATVEDARDHVRCRFMRRLLGISNLYTQHSDYIWLCLNFYMKRIKDPTTRELMRNEIQTALKASHLAQAIQSLGKL